MSDSNGTMVALMWIITVVLTILAGIISWNMINPDGFFSFIGFLAVWSALSSLGHLLAIAIAGWIDRL